MPSSMIWRVADTQLDAPSFVHAMQFDALQDDTEDEEALPADPPPVIHHTMFSLSDPDTEASEGGLHPQVRGPRDAV